MIAEFERYHGIVLREVVIECGGVRIASCDNGGRINCFSLDDSVGLLIKHSTSRLPPWSFTYDAAQMAEIESAFRPFKEIWLTHVCGDDGVLAISHSEFLSINPMDASATRFVRVDKSRNTMYRVFGTGGELAVRKPRGIGAVAQSVRSVS